jgi:hypothetical protein
MITTIKGIRKVIALYGTILIAGIQVMAFRMFVYDTL